jgi:methyltransferase (TIGR00027 family)
MTEGSPSATALYIAKKLIFASGEPGIGKLVPRPSVEISRRFVEYASPSGARQLRAYERPWVRVFVRLLERLTIPGMTLHYVVRKLHIEQVARQSFAEGFTQLVVLGAGFDTLTQRLAEDAAFDSVTLVEVDHPATQRVKREVLQQHGPRSGRVEFLPCDIGRDDISTAFPESVAPIATPRTLVIAEGLLMYLEPATVNHLLTSLRGQFGEGTRVAFTFMEPQPGGRIAFARQSRLVDLWLKWRGEPFRWAIAKRDLEDFLAPLGYSPRELVDAEAFTRLYLRPRNLDGLALADGDHLCIADLS